MLSLVIYYLKQFLRRVRGPNMLFLSESVHQDDDFVLVFIYLIKEYLQSMLKHNKEIIYNFPIHTIKMNNAIIIQGCRRSPSHLSGDRNLRVLFMVT